MNRVPYKQDFSKKKGDKVDIFGGESIRSTETIQIKYCMETLREQLAELQSNIYK